MDQQVEKADNCNAMDGKVLSEESPYLEWKYEYNKETETEKLDSLKLSDGSELTEENINKAIKTSSGTSDLKIGESIIKKVSRGFSGNSQEYRINEASALLAALGPKSPAEALLMGQFLALNDCGIKCLRVANLPDQGLVHVEKFFLLAHKLFNTANQTMQTILKYRSGGQQTIQVVHLHNEGQAIVTQNLSSKPPVGDTQ